MWETSEGDTKLSLRCKIKDVKRCRKQCSNRYYSLIVTLFIETIGIVHHDTYSLTCLHVHMIFFNHSTSGLGHTMIFLECMVNEHVCMSLLSLSVKFCPH